MQVGGLPAFLEEVFCWSRPILSDPITLAFQLFDDVSYIQVSLLKSLHLCLQS
jgi:hypothetical protein